MPLTPEQQYHRELHKKDVSSKVKKMLKQLNTMWCDMKFLDDADIRMQAKNGIHQAISALGKFHP